MKVPFISITDFMDCHQVQEMLLIAEKFNRFYLDDEIRKLGVGVMMSHKTLHGLPTRWASAFPEKEKIASIFLDHSLAFNVIHYADYKGINVLNSLLKVADYGSEKIHAIQLDMTWPDPKIIIEFRKYFSKIQIILQVGKKAFEVINDNPENLLAQLDPYDDSVDYVLLDKSMGQGKSLEAKDLLPYVNILATMRSDLGIVVAGGLGPQTIDLIDSIIEKYPFVSIDAQGKLRPSGNSLDPIDWKMAGEYLEKSFEKFSKNKF